MPSTPKDINSDFNEDDSDTVSVPETNLPLSDISLSIVSGSFGSGKGNGGREKECERERWGRYMEKVVISTNSLHLHIPSSLVTLKYYY